MSIFVYEYVTYIKTLISSSFLKGSQAEEEEGAAGGKHVIARGNGREVGARPHATVAQKIR
jgi:hypothetical protein